MDAYLQKNIYQCAILFECCIFQYSCSESFEIESFLNVSFFIFHVNDMFEGCSGFRVFREF